MNLHIEVNTSNDHFLEILREFGFKESWDPQWGTPLTMFTLEDVEFEGMVESENSSDH